MAQRVWPRRAVPDLRRVSVAKPKRADTGAWTPSQVVAHNMSRARQLRGLTQAEIAERLSRFTGAPWSDVTVAQAEGSVSGKRVRQFTANELVALARTFDLPVLYFFLPPEDRSGELRTPDAGDMPWEYLLLLVWGHRRNFPDVAERAAPWAHASTVLVPSGDVLDAEDEHYLVRDSRRHREHLTPQDILGVAFNGMARSHIRGSFAGKDLEELASNLRRLADAFDAFNNYAPGTFFDTETLRELARGEEPS
ncbi:MAG: helix-turn-helix domain-containing protein [Actinobacteria bacterium]|nr:helix-turn-helix domain-containing protein [Actinomycetota bacterium]